MDSKKIEIYTDGSCRGNPGPGGWAAIFLENLKKDPIKILKGHESSTTNNRMEMVAVIEALHSIHDEQLLNRQLILYSDSNLIIQTLLQGWKRKANKDLWEELDALREGVDIDFVWVKGHAKNKWNNECDKIAQSESLKAQKKSFTNPFEPITRTSRLKKNTDGKKDGTLDQPRLFE